MENDILDALADLCYKGPLVEDGALDRAVAGGAASPEFTKLCAWIVSEIKLYCKLEENVQATNSPTEAEGFQLEMSGLLAEMNCPYSVLTTGDVAKRLQNKDNCLLLLTYLISELEALKMVHVSHPSKTAVVGGGSDVFIELKGICVGLGMSKPPANIAMFQFFSGIEKKLKEAMSKVPVNHVGKPLMKKPLGPVHWEKIEVINQALVNEYEVRRKMLLKRLDVTVQSFGWSERAKTRADQLAKVYPPKRTALATKSNISIAHLYAAREDLSKILRTSSGRIREMSACAINKVLMGRVPDRGGRPNEIEPPPPEMPPWQTRQDGPQQYGGGGGQQNRGGGRGGYDQQSQGGRGGYDRGGGGRGGRGGKVQGGWGDGGGGGYQANYQGGGYQSRGGGGGGGYSGGGFQAPTYQGSGYQGGGGGGGGRGRGGDGGHQQDNRYQDGGYQDGGYQERGGRGGRGGRGRGNRGGQGGGWGGRGGQNLNRGGQFEQYFQQGGYHYNQAGFGQGKHYSS
ncbi:protein FAM98A-like [Polyodon spathula]|uniref:protein FAM98A-like n=1 Tax=Polyodon spathula TaxID=7913 RepID=UPI001B7DB225|nr:protein FAM98A-like [Polyodon spathula]